MHVKLSTFKAHCFKSTICVTARPTFTTQPSSQESSTDQTAHFQNQTRNQHANSRAEKHNPDATEQENLQAKLKQPHTKNQTSSTAKVTEMGNPHLRDVQPLFDQPGEYQEATTSAKSAETSLNQTQSEPPLQAEQALMNRTQEDQPVNPTTEQANPRNRLQQNGFARRRERERFSERISRCARDPLHCKFTFT